MINTDLIAFLMPIILFARMFMVSGALPQLRNATYMMIASLTLVSRYVPSVEVIIYIMIALLIIGLISIKNNENRMDVESD